MQRSLFFLARDPFVHFIALGTLIFIAAHALNTRPAGTNGVIELREADLQQLRAQSRLQWGKEPSAQELDSLVQAWVREEVLVREALAQGLDRDDVVVRHRLAQKMEFLAHASAVAPTEADLQAYHAAHAARYSSPPRVDLEQVYFSTGTRAEGVQRDTHTALQRLQRGQAVTGDRFMLPRQLTGMDTKALARDFGDDFTQTVLRLPAQRWSAPLASAHGWHLVRVQRHLPPQLEPLAAVRERVARDWANEKAGAQRDAAYAALRSKYTVVLPTAPAAPTVQVSALADSRVSP